MSAQIAPLRDEAVPSVAPAPRMSRGEERPWGRARKALFLAGAGLAAWGVVAAAAYLVYSLF